ncbi:HD domain-containing phosphohydrolase [Spirochaeta dissipatitropha]
MRTKSSLRLKLIVLIVPMTILVILSVAVISNLGTRAALTRVATRHLSYKAEQLRDFAWSEWEVLVQLEIEDNPEFLQATRESLRSYADFLLRSSSEMILAVDSNGSIVLKSGFGAGSVDEDVITLTEDLEPGWISGKILGSERVGIAFDFPPYDWRFAVTDLQSSFFRETVVLNRIYAVFLVSAFLLISMLTYYYVGYSIHPIEKLTAAIVYIRQSGDLTRTVDCDLNDETGKLAREFNAMLAELRNTISSLEKLSTSERNMRIRIMNQEEETLAILGKAVEFRDKETGDHQMRIGELAALFARLLGMDNESIKLYRFSAPLHDIGKIAVPDNILFKPGRLTREEYEIVKQHTSLGWELLRNTSSKYLAEGAVIALNHHEKWDGSGYPNALSGKDIPLSGRIVGIIDVLDALISHRPYKDPWPPIQALEYIKAQAGQHFDPELTAVFSDNFRDFMLIIEEFQPETR